MSNYILAIKVLIQRNNASWERHDHKWCEKNCQYYERVFVSITKSWVLKPSISSKDSDSDFFHGHISIKKIKEIYPEIVSNSFQFEPVTKDDI